MDDLLQPFRTDWDIQGLSDFRKVTSNPPVGKCCLHAREFSQVFAHRSFHIITHEQQHEWACN